ncbi:hypothetical protein CAOG_08127 [Capsaspora owczarzaki ATCC 30864]|uniref:DNA/RNA non-specific endonuclease/pyrophosphatase/phosphodiesterase domain-containing protein n=1 Tax=Capsaspora owczarzaki (strain ATCC 30864) TaxID=595528 RepID=A0A0D2WYP3_CAPO3|nr:hypothetical protein CAOG_08127 [Capsaspora owczarzaki ATCC 30864]KJE98108.1 hypothetical protein CAOG_008127 [Capsaspora owczarzaki ATCC 30864]|eukprot:XP_004342728.1 hypothetical protein CAOG_08127 [Capsaspora owczarzaki ATCC 30864]
MSYAAAFSTFAYINVVPMAARFNQLYWGPAETAFVEVVLAKGSGSQVFFLTGALGTPSQQTLNYGQPVPTGPFFTAMCIPGVGSGAAYAQFNSDERQLDRSDPDQRSAVEFMSLGELEALLGRGQMFAVNCGQANYKNDLIAAFAPAKKNNNGQSVTFNPDSHRRETQLLGNRDPGDRCTLDSECKIPMECITNGPTAIEQIFRITTTCELYLQMGYQHRRVCNSPGGGISGKTLVVLFTNGSEGDTAQSWNSGHLLEIICLLSLQSAAR